MAVDIAQLLAFAVKNNASDLHLSAGVPPMIRVDGDMKRVNMPALVHKEVHSMVYDLSLIHIYPIPHANSSPR